MENEFKLLKFLRFAPLFFILVISSLAIAFVSFEYYKNLEKEKEFFNKYYYEAEKIRIDELFDAVYKYIVSKEKNKIQDLKEQLKNYVDNAHSIMNTIYEENKDTKSKDEILSLMKDVLRNIKYFDGRGYFFIYELDGKNILNSEFPSLEGKNLWNFKDTNGVYILQEMKEILSSKNSTHYNWYWKEIDDEAHSEKIGYFKKFEPYGIFVGMGEYINNFNEQLQDEIIEYLKLLESKNNEYVFLIDGKDNNIIVDSDGTNVGKSIFDSSHVKIDETQKKKVLDIKNSEKPSTFIKYKILNEETNEFEYKTSYVKWFDKWDWFIGTGFKNKEIDEIIKKRENELEIDYENNINKILFVSIIVVFILMIISLLITNYIEKIFSRYKANINRSKEKLIKAHEIANMGDWEYCLIDKKMYWSNQVYKILNIDPENKPDKFTKSFANSLIHEDDLDRFNKAMHKTIKDGIGDDFIYRIYDSSMNLRYINFKSEKVSNTKLVGILQDVTARVEAELEKEKKDKMLFQQSKLAAMGEMIGNIAHQWRQPLSTISTVCTGIKVQKQHNILQDEQIIDGMNSINDSVQYLSNTIDDFRNFFEPKKDKLRNFDIAETFAKTLKLVSAQLMNKNIRVHKIF